MSDDLLKQLRDIHYPEPISLWPLAPGWYGLLVICLCLLGLGWFLWLRYCKKHELRKIVLLRIDELMIRQTASQNVAEELSMLLKRAVLAHYPRHEVAALYGEQWLAFLDKTSKSKNFSQGLGRLLIVSPYRGKQQKLPEQLFEIIKNWVKRNL
jgi:hypothetical protein